MYCDVPSFRSAVDDLNSAVRNEVVSRIGDAISGFNTRVRNISIDFNASSPTDDELTLVSSSASSYSDQLSTLSQSVVDKADELVTNHAFDRPLLRPTGERSISSPISFTSPNTVKYEFQNIGSKPWSGWIKVKAVDQYKNSVSVDFAPASIPVIGPGESAFLSREITIPKTVYVNDNPRSWGSKTKIHVSLYTRM